MTFDPKRINQSVLDNERARKEEDREGFKWGSGDFKGMLEEPWC